MTRGTLSTLDLLFMSFIIVLAYSIMRNDTSLTVEE